ncbi:serine/threonine-protein phosphatase 6 regulatory ankyrin repeat subunit C-like [Haliotis rubra]|uniref:serine/threonine-protein phosphatase 6 regulatory ankyrin repeat subunit C-like n=1 Tax=Haliotis rubra TaxID=36100 RepID=UPI001EE5234F|nr:serine/threonine-protein phosphatase 6 regulatory ankyrin repeat subunit C-like [Haliotis rubra]
MAAKAVFENITDATRTLIQYQDARKHVSTFYERSALKILRRTGSIFIKGKSGSGKSNLGLRLLAHINSETKRTPVVITSASQWNTIPKSGKENYIVMLDDIFGSSSMVQTRVDEWLGKFNTMWPFIETGRIFIVLTSRPEIYDQCAKQLNTTILMRNMKCLTLHKDEFKLRESEKRRFLKLFCGKSGFTKEDVQEIVEKAEPPLGFPQCCNFFAISRRAQSNGKHFFLKPYEFIAQELDILEESDPFGYFVLLLVMIHNGRLGSNELDSIRPSEDFHEDIEVLDHQSLRETCFVQFLFHKWCKDVAVLEELSYSQSSMFELNDYRDEAYTTVIEGLLRTGCKIDPESLLLCAACHATATAMRCIFKLLLHFEADPHIKDSKRRTVLHHAAKASSTSSLEHLVTSKLDLNSVDEDGWTAVHSAAEYGRRDNIKLLLDNGADLYFQDNQGRTALHVGCEEGHCQAVDLLLQTMSNPNVLDERMRSPLHFAARRGSSDNVKLLLDKGANPFEKDLKGRIPLHLAVKTNDSQCVKLLIAAKSDVCAADKNGDSPLHLVTRRTPSSSFELLLENGASSNIQNNDGNTALHLAVSRGLNKYVKCLLENGSNPCVQNHTEQTPLQVVTKRGNQDCVRLLLQYGANASVCDT